jgi:hypothetical protein
VAEALRIAFLEVDAALDAEECGCTATAMLLWRSAAGSVLCQVANVGDAAAVMAPLVERLPADASQVEALAAATRGQVTSPPSLSLSPSPSPSPSPTLPLSHSHWGGWRVVHRRRRRR